MENSFEDSFGIKGLPQLTVIFLIPLCVIYDIYCFFRIRINHFLYSKINQKKHTSKVRKIQDDVTKWKKSGMSKPMCTARPNYKSITFQTLEYKDKCHQIKIDLPDILSIDEEKRVVFVEPMVTIGQLNNFLVQQGWSLPVVPEIDDLTIGGLVMGGGIESTSHKYGLFHYICRSYEMVLADATVVTCSATQWPELYSAIPFSYGTLGFLTKIEIDIIPYRPFLKLRYINVHSLDEAVDVFKKETNDPSTDSVEGIMYSLNEGVIMSGQFTDECEVSQLNRIGRWYKPWFYFHVLDILKSGAKEVCEFIPSVDFFHRHDRSCFWLVQYLFPFGNQAWFRYLFGWVLPPKHSLIKFIKETIPGDVPVMSRFFCQDLGVTIDQLKETLQFVDKETGIYPIWLCPTRHIIPEELEHLAIFRKEDLHIDIGIYGFCRLKNYDKIPVQKRIERFCMDRKGYVALYAETQLNKEEFNEMFSFNMRNYDKIRKELKCEKAFPHVFEKVITGRGKL